MTSQIAHTIAQQLGGNRFLAMTGALLIAGENALTIKAARRTIVITLTPADTYLVEALKVNRRTFEVTRNVIAEDAYAEDLQGIFTEATGLATRL